MFKIFLLCLGVFAFANDFNFDDAVKEYEKQNYTKAFEIFSSLCDKNHVKACFSTALMYEKAYGVKQDMQKAQQYYALACAKQNSNACFNLASLQDEKNAKLSYKKACDLGHIKACNTLASLYEKKQDGEVAVHFYNKACEFQDGFACYKLANLNEQGVIIRQDLQAALNFYQKSCRYDFLESCYVLGRYYQLEKKDKNRAKKYLGKACDGSHTQACSAYRELD